MPIRFPPWALLVVLPAVAACGSPGPPRPPVYPNPPVITGLTAAQRGTFAILRFPQPPASAQVGADLVELEAVEVLVYAERYPVFSADALIAGVARHRDVMVQNLNEANAAARAAAAAEAAAAGDLPAPVTATPPRTRTRDEELLRRVPPDLLTQWRREGLSNEAILEGASRLANAAAALWSELGLPATILDPRQPPALPDPGRIAAASETILANATTDRQIAPGAFLARASVWRSAMYEDIDELLVEGMVQVAVPVGVPAPGTLRTRYFFAVRGRSDRQVPGEVNAVVSLAPRVVAVSPAALDATVSGAGVELRWAPPAGDVLLRRLDPATVTYNVYRALPDAIVGPTPLNPVPLATPEYTDTGIRWGASYVYEVRAVLAGSGVASESGSARTPVIEAVDRFPPAPPTGVQLARAGRQVTLQWTPSASIDLVGYRVYRHPFPAPPVPQRLDPTAAVAPADPAAAPAVVEAAAEQLAAAAEQLGAAAAESNTMIEAGWELLTSDPVPFSRHVDRDVDSTVRYVYAVEAVDGAGNLSAIAVGGDGTPS